MALAALLMAACEKQPVAVAPDDDTAAPAATSTTHVGDAGETPSGETPRAAERVADLEEQTERPADPALQSSDAPPPVGLDAATAPDAAAPSGTRAPLDADAAVAAAAPDAAVPAERIALVGRALFVDGRPFQVQGVAWSPVARGAPYPGGLDYRGFAEVDIALMRDAGINVVRTYVTIVETDVLDALYEAGIYVLNSAYIFGGEDLSVLPERINAVKDHPALLMWTLGNEWNYNGLYVGLSHEESLRRLNQAASLVKSLDPAHPIVSVYGELPSAETLAAMPDVDVWGINAYRGIGFGTLFEDWAARSEQPMIVTEYGADAYNALIGDVDLASQADATRALTSAILAQSPTASGTGACLGGTLFEWADEWWKDAGGGLDVHDVGGIAPGGGPHPDAVFNEEWWGIVDIDRNPRPAYEALKELYE